MIRLHLQIVLASVLFAAACGKTDTTSSGDDRPKTTDAANTPSSAGGTTGTTGTTGATGTTGTTGTPDGTADAGMAGDAPTGGLATGMLAVQPSDPQILHILSTANTGEVAEANLALGKSKDPGVKEFATAMVADHTAANEKGKALASKLTLTPEDNPTSQALKKAHDASSAKLATLEGAAFDQAYVDAAVAAHTQVLETIDQSLLPSAKNAELKAMVTEIRPTIAAHLEHSKTLQTKLSGAKPTP